MTLVDFLTLLVALCRVYIMMGCLLGIFVEMLDGSASKEVDHISLVRTAAITVFGWPWYVRALYREAKRQNGR